MTAPDLDALEKLADEATPGEWTTLVGSTPYPESDDADSWVAILSPAGKGILTFQERYRMGKDDDRADYDRDAAFIAAANPAAIKALIAELKEARGLLKRWQTPGGQWSADIDTSAFLARNGKGERS